MQSVIKKLNSTLVGHQCSVYLFGNKFNYLVFCKIIAPILPYNKCHW